MVVAEPRTRTSNGATQAGPPSRSAVREYVRAYDRQHRRGKTSEHLGVSRHTLWRFLERDQMGHAVPTTVLSSVGQSVERLKRPHFRTAS